MTSLQQAHLQRAALSVILRGASVSKVKPPEEMRQRFRRFDVGRGPVGLTLAIDLAWRGIDVTVVETAALEAAARKWNVPLKVLNIARSTTASFYGGFERGAVAARPACGLTPR
jgi:hypothetical protein